MRKTSNELTFYGVCVAVLLSVYGGWWVVSSYLEASAFRRVTGKQVSTWDAMWLDLRVQEEAK